MSLLWTDGRVSAVAWQGPNSRASEIITPPDGVSWQAFCDSLKQPAQGPQDVGQYGDLPLLVGLSGHYRVRVHVVTSAAGDHWELMFNATPDETSPPVYVAREQVEQEHYHATRDQVSGALPCWVDHAR
jgi:hypothetical protein